MTFLNPSAMWLSLLAIPMIVLYALKVRPPRVSVATTMFWESAQQQNVLWLPSYRLRDIASLMLQLALLALLIIALAEPRWGSSEDQPRLVVLVLDNSASMSATDIEPSRFEAAKDEAFHLIDQLSGEDQAALITAAGVPKLACRMTQLRSVLRRAIEATPQSHAPAQIQEAIALASEIPCAGKRHLVVISDRPLPVSDAHGFDHTELLSIGTAAKNVAITRFQARRSLNDPLGYQVLVEVQNNARQAESCRLEISLNDQMVDVVPLDLEPGERWSRVFDESSVSGGTLAARIDADDALVLDNEAWCILPERAARHVYLVGDDSLFLQQVLAAQPRVDLHVVDEIPTEFERGSLLVLNRKPVEELPSGALLVIEPVDSIANWESGESIDVSYGTAVSESVLLRHVRLDDVAFHDVREIELHQPADVAVRDVSDHPLLFTIAREQGDVVVFNFGVEKGDLPLRTAFPILVSNVLDRLSHSSGELIDSHRTGTFVALEEEAFDLQGLRHSEEASVTLHSPSGNTRKQALSLRQPIVGPLDECGVWTLELPTNSENAAPRSTEIACNLCNEEVSNLLVDKGEAAVTSSFLTADGQAEWKYIVLAAISLSLAEWLLYHRRWIQ